MQGREGRAEAWEAKFPERDASVPRRTASQQGVETPSQGPGDLTWSRQTSTPVRRRREATAREEPARANPRRRRTPNGDPSRRAELHARGLATRAAAGKRC